MRSISRNSYRTIYITIRTRTRFINLVCYCRYAANYAAVVAAVGRHIAKSGYAGTLGKIYFSRRLAHSVQSYVVGPCQVADFAA